MILAVDIGITGAVARKENDGKIKINDVPTVELANGRSGYDIAGLLDLLRNPSGESWIAVVEQTGPQPKLGCVQAFSMGYGLGSVLTALRANGAEVVLVNPRVWKKAMGLSADKELSRSEALRYFPECADQLSRKKDHNRAESLLLLKWFELKVV